MIWALLASASLAASVTLAPSGAVVVVRPDPGERIVILDQSGDEVALEVELPSSIVLNEASWRQIVASGQVQIRQAEEVDELRGIAQECVSSLKVCEAEANAAARENLVLNAKIKTIEEQRPSERRRAFFLGTGTGGALVFAAMLLLLI